MVKVNLICMQGALALSFGLQGFTEEVKSELYPLICVSTSVTRARRAQVSGSEAGK